jgi:hypothetical protein
MFDNPVKVVSWSLLFVMIGYMLTNYLALSEPYMWAYRGIILLILFFNLKKIVIKSELDTVGFYLTLLFIIWLFGGFVRASFYAEGYWLWKVVISSLLTTLFYVIVLVSTNMQVVGRYYGLYWKFFLPLVILSFLYDGSPLLLNYIPFSTLMLFFILIPKQKRWMLVGIVIFFFISNSQRNDLVKIIIASTIGISISNFYHFIPKWSIKFVHLIFLILPFVLLSLAVTDKFNVFKMDEYITGDYTQEITTAEGLAEDNLKADTRTFIYRNVFATMETYDAWIIGRSPAFGDEGVDDFWGTDETTGLKGRFGNEVGIMDILLWYGLVGVAIYFLIYVRASYLAIYDSRNRFAKAVGLYVAFLWMWAFIWEKPLFETFFMIDLVLIGLCFSNKFRQFTDNEMEIWVRSIFSPRIFKH